VTSMLDLPCPACGAVLRIPKSCRGGLCRRCGGGFAVVEDADASYLVPLGSQVPGEGCPEVSCQEQQDQPEEKPDQPQVAEVASQERSLGTLLEEARPSFAWTIQDFVRRVRPWASGLAGAARRVPASTWHALTAGVVAGVVVLLLGRACAGPPSGSAPAAVPSTAAGTPAERFVVVAASTAPADPAPLSSPVASASPSPSPELSPVASPSPSPSPSPEPSPVASASPGLAPGPAPSALAASPAPASSPGPTARSVERGGWRTARRARAIRPQAAPSPSATPEPSPSAAPAPSPSPSPSVSVRPLADASLGRQITGVEGLKSKPFLLVTKVERSTRSVVVWCLLVNTTNSNFNFQAPRLLDAHGVQFERSSNQAWERSGGTAAPSMTWGLWPGYARAGGQEPRTLVLPTEELGSLQVLAEDKMSNYGPWDSLPQSVRSRMEDAIRHFKGLRWWGNSSRRRGGVPSLETKDPVPDLEID